MTWLLNFCQGHASFSLSHESVDMSNWWSNMIASSAAVSVKKNQVLSMNDVQNDRSTEVGVYQWITTTSFDLVSTGLPIIAVSNSLVHRVLSPHLKFHRNRVAVIVLNRRTVSFKRLTSVIVSVSHCRDWCLVIYSYHWERVPESIHTICVVPSNRRSPMNGRSSSLGRWSHGWLRWFPLSNWENNKENCSNRCIDESLEYFVHIETS